MTQVAKRKAGRKAGKLFVISAPSGCGKTTLCNKLLEERLGLVDSVSMTTRPPRAGEREGVDYNFVSRKRFEDMVKSGKFLEYEDNFGHLYGTPRKAVADNLKKGKNVLLSIDVKGAMKVRKVYGKKSVLVFILPPSLQALKARLQSRMSDAREAIATRLNTARKEMSYKKRYDYRVVNDKLAAAYRRLKKIVVAELNT